MSTEPQNDGNNNKPHVDANIAKPRNVGGRPTMYTPELADRICAAIASQPYGLRMICESEDDFPAESTVYLWLYKHVGFLEKYAQAREVQAEAFAQDTIFIADTAGLTNERINKARLQIDTRKWAASKLAPKKYGDSTIIRGDKDNPVLIGISNSLQAALVRRDNVPAITDQKDTGLPIIEAEAITDNDVAAPDTVTRNNNDNA